MGRVLAGQHQICERCEFPIAPGSDIMLVRGGWVHPACAPGGSDE